MKIEYKDYTIEYELNDGEMEFVVSFDDEELETFYGSDAELVINNIKKCIRDGNL